MGKETYLKRFNELKKIIIDSTDKVELKKNEDLISSTYIENGVFQAFFSAVIKAKGPKGVFDGLLGVASKDEKIAQNLVKSFNFYIDTSFIGLKEETDKLFEGKELNDIEKAKVIFEYMLSEPISEEKAKLCSKYLDNSRIDFACSATSYNFDNMETFIESCNLDDKDYPDVSNITTAFESPNKGLKHPFEKEINELIENEKKKANPDFKLIDSLKASNDVLTDVTDGSDLLSNMAEEQGKMAEKVFDLEYNKYQEDNQVSFVEKSRLDTPEKLIEYSKNDIIGEVKYSDKFISILTKCVNNILEKGYDKAGTTSGIFSKDADKLVEAIKAKDAKNIKELADSLYLKMHDVDEMIAELKSIDDKHMFNSNFASSRESYYPGKYRIDYEGATLMNHALLIAGICRKYDVTPDQLINDPITTVKSIYKKAKENPDSPYNKFIHDNQKDSFEKVNHILNDDEDLYDVKDEESRIDNDFIQLSPVLSVNNPEHRIETFHKVTSDIRATMWVRYNNDEILYKALHTKEVYSDIFPKLAIMGRDFNVHKHFNCKGLCDVDTKDYRKPFELQDYMKHMSPKEIFDKYSDTYRTYDTHKTKPEYINFETGMNNLETEVSKSFVAKGMDQDTVSLMVSFAKEKSLTPMQVNTSNAILNFYGGKGTATEIANNKIGTLADLDKKYNSHNFLAQILFPKLRAQNSLIKKMRANLMEVGYTSEELDAEILAINHPEKVKAKTNVNENKIETLDKGNNEKKFVDPRGYTLFNLDDKMADLDDKLVEYCKSEKKNSLKKELLNLGVTEEELTNLSKKIKKNTANPYSYTKGIISRIEKDFIKKERANDTHIINDIGFNKPSIDWSDRNEKLQDKLHIDTIQNTKENVKFDSTNSERKINKPNSIQLEEEAEAMLIAGGIYKANEHHKNPLKKFEGLSRRQQNECKRAYLAERGIEKPREVTYKNSYYEEHESIDHRTDDEKAADYLKELHDAEKQRTEQFIDTTASKASRTASLAKLYKEDNPNITADELLIRGKLAADEIQSDMDVNKLKELVDKRFELFTIGKENTNGSESELINDVLKQGNNSEVIDDLIKEAKEDLGKLDIDDKEFEESNPAIKEEPENENGVIVQEELEK